MPQLLQEVIDVLRKEPVFELTGRLSHIDGPTLYADMANAKMGDICRIKRTAQPDLLAEVVSLRDHRAVLAPMGSVQGLTQGAEVVLSREQLQIPVGRALLGRVIDALGHPIDDGPAFSKDLSRRNIKASPPAAMTRPMIEGQMITGVRAIDGLITLGRGQRIAIFGSPGTGKSRLLAEIASHAEVDVVVVGLVGERGREVRELIDRDLPASKRKNITVVAATSDQPAVDRALCAQTATAVAEHFSDQGMSVLLVIDSLTRTARALREIGLSTGEQATRRGYPSSVYAALPKIIERSGRTPKGDITAIYTVLVEGDGEGDPIAEEVRSLTDGHIVLSPKLAEDGHFPAIDVLDSLSRVMSNITDLDHQMHARNLRKLLAKHRDVELLVQIGEYEKGTDPAVDRALEKKPEIDQFLQQYSGDHADFSNTLNALRSITS